VPGNVTLWSWLFDTVNSSARYKPVSRKGGFRDAATGQLISFQDVVALATSLSTTLAEYYGIVPGDGVCILASNSIWYPIALFAAIRLGAVVTCSSPEYNTDEALYILKSAEAKVIFADLVALDTVRNAANMTGFDLDHIIRIEPPKSSTDSCSIQNLIVQGSRRNPIDPFELRPGQHNKDVCAYLSFTSGTTSKPKGVSSDYIMLNQWLTAVGDDFSS
jgi:4-coumarate--CoA ligase